VKALELDDELQKAVHGQINRDIETQLQKKNFAAALSLAEELQCVDPLRGRLNATIVKFESGDAIGAMGAMGDLIFLIEMPDVPVELRAGAMSSIGVVNWQNVEMRESLMTFQEAMQYAPRGSEIRCDVMFSMPVPMLEIGLLEEVVSSLRQAFQENEQTCSGYSGTLNDLFWMVLRRGSGDWERYVASLLPLYVEFGVTETLGSGLTHLIEKLDQGDFTYDQLDLWNSLWHKHGVNIEALEIPLSCLAAAIAAIMTKSDRALFALPIEVHSLVRSLLNKSLGNEA